METKQITLRIPNNLYKEIIEAKKETGARNVAEFIRAMISEKIEERQWRRNLKELQEEVRKSGGLGLGKTKEEVIEALRRSRQEIFDAEYAHLYR